MPCRAWLERPSATQSTTRNFYASEEDEYEAWDAQDEYGWQDQDAGWQQDEWPEEPWPEEGDMEDPWAGMSEDVPLDESTIQTVLAVYPAVRQRLHSHDQGQEQG
eukprot:6012095-Amphidinium_carterae.1